jgi:hypothetical protein
VLRKADVLTCYGQPRGTAQGKENGTHLMKIAESSGPLRGGLLSSEEITEQRTMAALARDVQVEEATDQGCPVAPSF